MRDTSTADLAKATEYENTSIADYEGLMKAKTDTKKSLGEDKTFLTDLAKNCKTKKAEWSVRENLRAEEQLALADTINILNYDDALELFSRHSRSSRCSR